jgi:peptide-methionine (S)-S-oxide reductase
MKKREELATVAGGCFWCVEAVFERIPGVSSVVSGYAGGHVDAPTYEQVCAGTTGHAEVAQITFDPDTVSYEKLLQLFWHAHDPTTVDRQGADVGSQYRSAIFTHSDTQRVVAERSKALAQKQFSDPIVTEIRPLDRFYPAENYHQDYYRQHSTAPYCLFVIRPKLKKLNMD